MEENRIKIPTAAALSYIGDARHSLYVRIMLTERGICKSAELNSESLKYVTAEAQARMLERILPLFTEEEAALYKRAFNSSHLNKPKHASGKDYRMATGFEAVIGLLAWRGDEERLDYLFKISHSEDIKNDSEN